jgi:hypothetical protein
VSTTETIKGVPAIAFTANHGMIEADVEPPSAVDRL